MSDFTPLREGVDQLASRSPLPEFGDLKRRASRRRRTRRVAIGAAVVAAAVIVGSPLALTALGDQGTVPADQPNPTPKPATAPNGWVAVDAYQGGGEIYLSRLGESARRLEVAGSEAANDACPAWSPDGTRLLFGRLTGPSDTMPREAKLVIVPVDQDGIAGRPTEIELDGFEVIGGGPEGFDAHPCGIWAPDGRWVAFAGTGEVWVVDTQTGEIRRLPDLRPSDLEWRPGTDELTIAGDVGTNRGAPWLSTPVTVYSVSTGEVRQLGAIEAAFITWSPDGSSLAYTGGERAPDTRELRLVDSDGSDDRLLVSDMGPAIHGVGPVWSPAGDRIAYQRCVVGPEESTGRNPVCSGERHEVVLVRVADGTETVIAPPEADGHVWYPFTVSWSPDGTTLLYAAWRADEETLPGGVIAVPADSPSDAAVLIDSIDPVPNYSSHRWVAAQMWGR